MLDTEDKIVLNYNCNLVEEININYIISELDLKLKQS